MKHRALCLVVLCLAAPLSALAAPDLLGGKHDTADNAPSAVVSQHKIVAMLRRQGYRIQSIHASDSSANYIAYAVRSGQRYELRVDAHNGRITREHAVGKKKLIKN